MISKAKASRIIDELKLKNMQVRVVDEYQSDEAKLDLSGDNRINVLNPRDENDTLVCWVNDASDTDTLFQIVRRYNLGVSDFFVSDHADSEIGEVKIKP